MAWYGDGAHETWVDQDPARMFFIALCTCGWRKNFRPFWMADMDAKEHADR